MTQHPLPRAMARDGTPAARVALVGGGPTTLYALQRLIPHGQPLDIHIFERDSHAGPGMPYRDGLNDPQMLANIGSRELPPLVEGLEEWLRGHDAEALRAMGLRRADIGPEAFYPRVVLGRYFTAQLAALVARARARGHQVTLRARHRVRDLRIGRRLRLDWDTPFGAGSAAFTHVVLATGHQWQSETHASGVRLQPPWPVSGLRRFIGRHAAILGSSLTAIDAAVALAGFHGRFIETEAGLRWEREGPRDGFALTMMSRKGLLPPADWYYTQPLPAPRHLTREALRAAVAQGSEGLLQRCHALLVRELTAVDAERARALDLARIEGLAGRVFADRMAQDPWQASRADLQQAAEDRAARRADPWRMAWLGAHEVLEEAVPHLTEPDRRLLERELKPVFTDCYASVPHRSIRRMLALHEAGVLSLVRLGSGYSLSESREGVRIRHAEGTLQAAGVIDARGQQASDLVSLFPGLRGSDGAAPGFDPVSCAVTLPEGCAGTLSCVAIPVLLPSDPFVQGLGSARDLGHRAAERIIAAS
jgi:uncharacterized NAD(P)/FAD-binding protein YdhS